MFVNCWCIESKFMILYSQSYRIPLIPKFNCNFEKTLYFYKPNNMLIHVVKKSIYFLALYKPLEICMSSTYTYNISNMSLAYKSLSLWTGNWTMVYIIQRQISQAELMLDPLPDYRSARNKIKQISTETVRPVCIFWKIAHPRSVVL